MAPSPTVGLVCGLVGLTSSWGPDLDHPSSLGSKRMGPVSVWLSGIRVVRWAYRLVGFRPMPLMTRGIRGLSRAVGLPAHRGLSHTVLAALVAGVVVGLVAGMVAVGVALLLGVAATAGYLAALAGDWCTKSSLPHLWWPWQLETPGPPRMLRVRTGSWVELVLILPLVAFAAIVLGGLVVAS